MQEQSVLCVANSSIQEYNPYIDNNLFQGVVKVHTGGEHIRCASPRAIWQNRLESGTDGIVRMKETLHFSLFVMNGLDTYRGHILCLTDSTQRQPAYKDRLLQNVQRRNML